MRLGTDDRAVTVQIGTVLLFAVLIVLLSTYQATVVPQQNERTEFNHNQEAQGDLQDLRDELLRTGTTGSSGSASVALGTQYPVRAFFVNPPSPSGSLRTTDAASVTIENVTADGELFDYWNGTGRDFETRGLVYEPNYHEYQHPPTTVYRNGVLYNRFDDANITLADQRLIRGDTISLVAVDGSLSESGSGTAGVDVQAVSAARQTVTVRNETDENATIVVPTTLPKENATGLWRELLEDEERVRSVAPGDDDNSVRIELKPGTYRLKLAKVGVGADATDVDPHYVTTVEGDNESVSAGGKRRVVAEVRDRFNNPVAGAAVNVADESDDSVTPEEVETDADGRATFVYHADDPDLAGDEASVTLQIGDGAEDRERATVTLHVESGGGDGGDGSSAVYDVRWTDAEGTQLDECDVGDPVCNVTTHSETTIKLTANVSVDKQSVAGATVDYAVNNTSVATDVTPENGGTDADGLSTTEVTLAPVNGSVTAYAASGDDVDGITLRVTHSPTDSEPDPNPPTLNWSVTDNTDVSGNEPRYRVSYNVSNAWSSFDGVEVEFGNRDSHELNETIPSNATQGTVEYSAGYGEGNTYDLTIRALATNGSVLAERSVVDDANGIDPDGDDDLGSPSDPELAGRWITDASDEPDGAVYSASYNVTNRDEFERVEVVFRNLDDDSTTRSETLYQPRGRASYAPGYGNGQDYDIVFRVYDSNGLKVDDLTVSDVADGDEPADNQPMANATSSTLANVDVSDVSDPWNSKFEVAYDVSDSFGTFGSVEVEYKNLDTGETVETDVATTTSGQVQLDTYQNNGDEFEIAVRVYDESGTIVDVETLTDTGDGSDP